MTDADSFDWFDKQSYLFLNPKLPKDDCMHIKNIVSNINEKSHIFLTTSGSTSTNANYKLVALHKEAFLNSSESVNKIFKINKNDILLNLLPTFHVGGLSLFSRAFLSNAKLVNIWRENFKWDVNSFVNICKSENITITSLVPTQMFDLVKAQCISPPSLRCVFVGGGAFSKETFLEAQKLGWPIYPTYGMTECCSQVATMNDALVHEEVESKGSEVWGYATDLLSNSDAFALNVLPHLNVSINENSCISISGNSLLSYYILFFENDFMIQDPKVNHSFITQDIGMLENQTLYVLGRTDDNIKINGEFVNLIHVNHLFQKCKIETNTHFDSQIISVPHERSGSQLVVVFLNEYSGQTEKISKLQSNFNSKAMPYERIHKIIFVEEIPRTDLGKIKTQILKQTIQEIINSP